MIGKQRWLALALLALSVMPVQAQEERFDGVTIRVATWGGSWRDRMQELIGAEFEKRGGKVEYVIGNALENFNKLIAARGQKPPFDVMEFQSDLWKPLLDAGFLAPLPFAKLPNAAGSPAAARRGNDGQRRWRREEIRRKPFPPANPYSTISSLTSRRAQHQLHQSPLRSICLR